LSTPLLGFSITPVIKSEFIGSVHNSIVQQQSHKESAKFPLRLRAFVVL